MSMWTTVVSKIKELMNNMTGTNQIEKELNLSIVISPQMKAAIEKWSAMYKDKAVWLHEPTDDDPTRVASLSLASMIASEKARIALLEFESEITPPMEEVEVPNPEYPGQQKFTEGVEGEKIPIPTPVPKETIKELKPVGDTQRAEYLESQYKKLKKQLRKQIEYGIAKGGLVIKPYIVRHDPIETDDPLVRLTSEYSIEFDFIQADAFFPLACNASDKITEAVFIQSKIEGDTIYRRLEYHKWENNTSTIINKAYKSKEIKLIEDMTLSNLGKEIELSEVPEWKDLAPETVIQNVEQPLFAYFKMPEANIIDTTSPLGVSGFSRAVNLIRDADMQYSRLLWEYEGGELAIDIDRDALVETVNADGSRHTHPTILQQRLFRKVDLGEADTYQQFAPSLRDSSYIQGLNTILMKIEDTCGISRGTLSDNTTESARTATELKILKQRSYQTNADIQKAIEEAIREVIYTMNVYCTLYEVTPEGDYDVSFEWDDSIITDVDTELEKRLLLFQNGVTSKKEVRMWFFGETERQAEEALTKVQEESANDEASESAYLYGTQMVGQVDNQLQGEMPDARRNTNAQRKGD